LTLGIMGIAFPQSFGASGLRLTLVVMIIQIVVLLVFAATGRRIGRAEGALIFLCYPLYVGIQALMQRGWL
jgi:Ca2+/Na+ antiporter